MQRELSYSIKLMVELMLLSVLVTIAISFAYLSNLGVSNLRANENAGDYMKSITELYHYNGSVVTGSDVIDCISQNIGKYHFFVYDSPVVDDDARILINLPKAGPVVVRHNYEYLCNVIGDQEVSYYATLVFIEEVELPDGTMTYDFSTTSPELGSVSGVLFEAVGG